MLSVCDSSNLQYSLNLVWWLCKLLICHIYSNATYKFFLFLISNNSLWIYYVDFVILNVLPFFGNNCRHIRFYMSIIKTFIIVTPKFDLQSSVASLFQQFQEYKLHRVSPKYVYTLLSLWWIKKKKLRSRHFLGNKIEEFRQF